MTRSALPFVLAVSVLTSAATAGVLVRLFLPGASDVLAEDEQGAELERLQHRFEELALRLDDGETDDGAGVDLEGEPHGLVELARRVDALEQSAGREPALADRGATGDTGGVATEATESGATSDDEREDFAGLLTAVLRGGAGEVSPDDQARFWELARSTGMLDDLLAELEAATDADPNAVAARLDLADAYVAKLLTVPAGPERGVWGMRADEQWRAALELDPQSWDAQFKLAESHSYYPSFLNNTGEAITGLERALEIQRGLAPEAKHAQTYVLLARMYAQNGDPQKSVTVLEQGLALHPGHAGLTEMLAKTGGGDE